MISFQHLCTINVLNAIAHFRTAARSLRRAVCGFNAARWSALLLNRLHPILILYTKCAPLALCGCARALPDCLAVCVYRIRSFCVLLCSLRDGRFVGEVVVVFALSVCVCVWSF